MRDSILCGIALVMISAPAHAGLPVPSPEAGAGLASLALVSAGYAWLRKRARRS